MDRSKGIVLTFMISAHRVICFYLREFERGMDSIESRTWIGFCLAVLTFKEPKLVPHMSSVILISYLLTGQFINRLFSIILMNSAILDLQILSWRALARLARE